MAIAEDLRQREISKLRPHQLDLLRRTIASDCNREEFDLFIETAEHYGLDPFRRHIMPLVFGKDQPQKRRMVIIVGMMASASLRIAAAITARLASPPKSR